VKIEVRCATCGKGYLVEETKVPAGGGFVPCQACGAMIVLGARAAEPAPAPMAAQSVPTAPSTPATVLVAAAPAAGNEVCCPRCGLHFSPTAERQVEPSTRPTVLLVEDLDYFVEIARDALAGRYELKCAKTVAEARAFLKQGGIDLMLLDLMLEGSQEGLRLLREPPGKTCPVLLFTAQDESEMYGEGWTKLQSLGVDDVVIKGMNMGEMLTRKVAALLGEPLPHDAMNR
jgi:CheY-like chemotaxis protein/DNA-directed RNA polymerase subunit RPC12/RpoP